MAKIGDIRTKCGDVLTEDNIRGTKARCAKCIAGYQLEYRSTHKRKAKEYMKIYYIEKKEQVNERIKAYNLANRDSIIAKRKIYRENNKHKIVFSRKRYTLGHVKVAKDYLVDKYCLHCGETNPIVLDYHHRDRGSKLFSIAGACSSRYNSRISIEQLKAEIDKCDILCANCHIKLGQSLPMSRRVRKLSATKDEYLKSKGNKCELCGVTDSLEFHHRDPSTKVMDIGTMVRSSASKEDFIAEMDKCQILCRNCHRIHHHNERQEKYEQLMQEIAG